MPHQPTISEAGRACLRLHLCEGVGPIRFLRLVEHFGSAEAVLKAARGRLQEVEGVGPRVAESVSAAARIDVDGEISAAADRGVRIIGLGDDDYPPVLAEITDPPICLYVRGEFTPADEQAVAVVGSRHCTNYGAEQARRFGAGLARAGLTVVSGLARGVDGLAQAAALDAGGRTIAVLGCGLSEIYPPEHAELAERIASSGAVVSELPMSTPPDDKHFPRRNRIIAGLSRGVLVVEGNRKSGSLITARLAMDYDREVFAIPGRIDSPTADGPNVLIRDQQAKLVMRLEDIIEELGVVGAAVTDELSSGRRDPAGVPQSAVSLTPVERAVLEAMGGQEATLDALLERVGHSASEVASALTMLQLKACVRQRPGNVYVPTGRAVQ